MPLPALHYDDGRRSTPGHWRWWTVATAVLVVLVVMVGASVVSSRVLRARSEARAAAAERAFAARQAADLAQLRAEVKATTQRAAEDGG